MQDPWTRLYQRMARDDAVSEVVAYTLMFAMGAVALTFSMDVLVDTQKRGTAVATATQVSQMATVTASLVHDAARAANNAPNATFTSEIVLPDTFQDRDFEIKLVIENQPGPVGTQWSTCAKKAYVEVTTTRRDDISETASLNDLVLAEVIEGECLQLDTTETVASSTGAMRVVYELDSNGHPVIRLDSANR